MSPAETVFRLDTTGVGTTPSSASAPNPSRLLRFSAPCPHYFLPFPRGAEPSSWADPAPAIFFVLLPTDPVPVESTGQHASGGGWKGCERNRRSPKTASSTTPSAPPTSSPVSPPPLICHAGAASPRAQSHAPSGASAFLTPFFLLRLPLSLPVEQSQADISTPCSTAGHRPDTGSTGWLGSGRGGKGRGLASAAARCQFPCHCRRAATDFLPSTTDFHAKILPVVKNQHLLLCTLLICNAGAMEALPIFLDSLVTAWGAILISVTLILLFGEILPQSICSHYGLAIGASVAPLVRVLVWICFPIAYPISKITGLLDYLVGHGQTALFRRAELKTLVTMHGNEAGKGGELTHDETTIIAGALELTEKKAKDAMTPLCQTFAIDINAKLDRNLMQEVLEKGHSRVPVYYEKKTNIIGLILVKNLLSVNADDEVPIKSVTIRKIPCVLEDMPLYDILNEFQKGHSHMAVVIRKNNQSYPPAKQAANDGGTFEVSIAIDDKNSEKVMKNLPPPLQRWKSYPNTQNAS